MKGEITLADALEQVEANGIQERGKGLANLKHVLRNNNKFDSLSDASFHKIYEVLYPVAVSEQTNYLKAKTTTTRSAAENRLSDCGNALRLAVEVGVRIIRLKTVRSVLDHIIETLPLPDGRFCEPLALDYAKCFRSALSYQAHVEHLPQQERERAALFCVDCIRNAESEVDGADAAPGVEGASITGTHNGFSYKSSRSYPKDSGGSQGGRSLAKQVAEEMVACLSLLTAAPNAASGNASGTLLWALVEFLKRPTIAKGSHKDAFAAINHILAWTRTEDISLTRKAASPLLRLISFYWTTKASTVLKDEMLATCLYLRPYFLSAVRLEDDHTLRRELEGVLEVLKNEYGKQKEKDQLLLDEIRLEFHDMKTDQPGKINTALFRLPCGNTKAEANWTIVYLLASLCNILSDQARNEDSSGDEEEEEEIDHRPKKRQRLNDKYEDLLMSSVNGTVSSRACNLQTLAFLTQQKTFSSSQLSEAIEKLSATCAEDNVLLSSWALLALAGVASQRASNEPQLSTHWTSVWQLATRAMSNVSTCRAACHLLQIILTLKLVPQQSASELVQTLTSSMDLNGPSTLADSVLHLLTHCVNVAQQINPTSSSATAESILSWLFRNYAPSKFEDKTYASQHSLFNPSDVIELIACSLGIPNEGTNSLHFPIWGRLGHVWLACEDQERLIAYLLLLPETSITNHDGVQLQRRGKPFLQSRVSCEPIVLNNLISELHKAQEAWSQITHDRPLGISLDMFTFFCTACYIVAYIAFSHSFRDSRRQAQLQRQIHDLLISLANFVPTTACAQDKIDAMLKTFACGCTGLLLPEAQYELSECENVICRTISAGLETRRKEKELNGFGDVEDPMEMDDAQDSQDSRHPKQSADTQDLTNDSAVSYSNFSLRASVPMYAFVVSAQTRNDSANPSASKLVVDHILPLPEPSILAGRYVISALSHLGVDLTADDSYRLLDCCTEKILQAYSYERSEVATGAILDIMSSLISAWTSSNNQSLFELGIDMYGWYTTTALTGGVLSPNVQKRVAGLLLQLCHVDTDYGRDEDVPSVRTSLFKLLQLGSIDVQFHLANRISAIFGLFVLSNHSAMFDDLQQSLPADIENVEGMAMRLLFLAKLASAWHSLLRQCVYYIFETAGQVKSSANHAGRSINELAKSLKFDSPQKLFRLFAPQLLHTWLESHTVSGLPFAIFQYDSLEALIAQNQAEIVAQLLIRGKDEGMQAVASQLKTTKRDLVLRSFAKCEAYSISWDISKLPASGNVDTSESRLRKIVGNKEDFRTLVTNNFAPIMGQFYLSLSQEDVEEKWLEKRTEYGFAANALAEMKGFSHSDRALPATQQPSFKSKYLCDQIERLCRRTSHNPTSPWEPSSFALAVRQLLDSVEDALGPLHTCLAIRRLRLLTCMSGDVATSGFPVEMLIHSLRPFLSDSQCADDTIGVLHYLLHRGTDYLNTNLPFLYGMTTLMVLQMRKHATGKQESTTQESQHKTTVHKMQTFQAYLVKLLQRCQPPDASLHRSTCTGFATALAQVSLPGNARKGSPESSLLLLLLDQSYTDSALLRAFDRDEALALLSDNFESVPPDAQDCLEDDQSCAYFAPKIWDIIRIPTLSETFMSWAAVVLGRAYASTGKRPLNRNSNDESTLKFSTGKHEGVARSQEAIAQKLSDSLFSRNRFDASVADYTLRSIVLSFSDTEEALAFEQMLPSAVVPAIAGGTYGYSPALFISSQPERKDTRPLRTLLEPSSDMTLEAWAQEVCLALCSKASNLAILPALTVALQHQPGLAIAVLPCLIHIILAKELGKEPVLRSEMSTSVAAHLADEDGTLQPKQRYLLQMLLYLRSCPYPGETTHADRLRWLDVDWVAAAQAASKCEMPTTALLFAESASQPTHGSRRASSRASMSQVSITQIPQELLLSVFKMVEEPDSFYGVEQSASLDSVLDRLDYEADGFRSLMLRSAQTDAELRRSHRLVRMSTTGIVHSLSVLNMDSLTFALLSGGMGGGEASEDIVNSARRLQQWDIVPPDTASQFVSNSFTAFQELSRANDRATAESRLRAIIGSHTKQMTALDGFQIPPYEWFSVLASLVEATEIVSRSSAYAVRSTWEQMQSRQPWMCMARFDDFRSILSNRNTLFSVLAQNKALSAGMGNGLRDCRGIEIESLLNISRLAREHGQLQEALGATSQIGDLIHQNKEIGIKAEAAAKFETASVLWDSGEVTASVKMLRDALAVPDLDSQDITVGRSGLLAQLAHQLAEARLEKPDEIYKNYLKPAISHLQGRNEGQEAGKVFHEFASFCDKQLQTPGNIEDFDRIAKLRQRKLEEVEELERMSKTTRKREGDRTEYDKDLVKAKQWFAMDDAEYQRLKNSRDFFMQQSLQNYLLALRASDEHDISILRFFALWLENSDVQKANEIVNKYLPGVPSWKFVVLMNQLMSRLEYDNSTFQSSLKALALRICSEHPHHSLHHLFATTRKPSSRDQAAQSRYDVGTSIRKALGNDAQKAELLNNVFKANNMYHALAVADTDPGRSSQIALKDLPAALQVSKRVPDLRVPPPTINVRLRQDCDYSNVPVVTKFGSVVRVMTGISKPKKLVAITSDGQQYAQLFKGGTDRADDLRQDAIMEQVFEEVSKMLRNHKTTRQRNLHVRTYKVIPLSPKSGIIEFVPNSTSFSDFLVPAHERYHPKDYKNSQARQKIQAVRDHSVETRLKEYRKVCENMQPVLRHFFFERYNDPDEWFEKRTAYTRTTATVSILGHVLGLGDRHCQNIMLDEKTGEVVHIDLGVAFEAGRVLPVPELVPFRLTRDVVDGMGITKTEGVFRRCCEFTMDALREDKDSIMTLLNVLRYDPLYTWTVSPLRAKRIQEETGRNAGDADVAEGSSKKKEQEAGEADRALSVVEKKLSKTLSTAATVNELIQQATEERNLATLFSGWSAYF